MYGNILVDQSLSWLVCCVTAGKSGGGFQGREVKTKSTKKKYLGRDKDEADSDQDDLESTSDTVFMSCTEISDELQRHTGLVDCSPEFRDAVASHLYRYVIVIVQRTASSNVSAENLKMSGKPEISGNLLILQNSGSLKYTPGIFVYHMLFFRDAV